MENTYLQGKKEKNASDFWDRILGPAKALVIARHGYSKTLHLPTFVTSNPGGSAGSLEIGARVHSVPLGRPESPLETARFRWSGDATLGMTTNACSTHHTETKVLLHGMKKVCKGNALVYIYIYQLVPR